MLPLIAVSLLVCCSLMVLVWALQLRTGNAGVVDAVWALSIGGLAVAAALAGGGWLPRRIAIAAVMALWGVRLGGHLLRDRVIGKPEDGRYTALRREWGAAERWRMLLFFQTQALAVVFFAMPAFIATANPSPRLSTSEALALILWSAAFAGETLADRQLERFKSDAAHRGQTCRNGLWRYSRHPNYFFEWVMWVAYALFALSSPFGTIALLCPLAMLHLLLHVTGVPLAEAQALRSRGDDYRQYQRTTNAFFPWRPRT
jgi:steroid 5-alpha reductase family enzyme